MDVGVCIFNLKNPVIPWNSFMDPFPDEGEVMDPGVSPQDFSGRTSQQDFSSNNGAISKPKDKDKDKDCARR